MDTNTLVSDLVEDGKRIVEQLPQNGFDVTAAFWLKAADDGQWRFYIVSPDAVHERLNKAYQRLFTLIGAMPQPHWLDPLEVKLIGPNSALAKDVLAIHARASGFKGSPIRWGGTQVGNISIEGAYLYPLPATATAESHG
jgi:hypothetical protein